MTSMVEVARMAGVSLSTVSHVVNGTRLVAPSTRARVMGAIEATGYRQNSVARALRRATTESIGLVISEINNPYFTAVIGGVEEAAIKSGYSLLLTNAAGNPGRELAAIDMLMDRRVDGLVVSLTGGPREEVLGHLSRVGAPVVLIDRLVERGFDEVGTQNEEACRLLVDHLVSQGHTRIGYIAGIPGISTDNERRLGYRRGLADHGIDVDESLIAIAADGGSSPGPSITAIKHLMRAKGRPSAVMSSNNMIMLGVIRGLAELGLRVPRDIAVVTWDDFEWSDSFEPRMTAVAQPSHKIGQESVRLLLSRIRSPKLPARSVRLKPTLVHRTSCGCPPDAPNPWADL